MKDYLRFWGKAKPAGGAGPSWHPLAYHLLDVAAVMREMLESRPGTLKRAAWLLQMSEDDARTLLVGLAAVHDIGKFAPKFQELAKPDGWIKPESLEAIDASRLQQSRHTRDGYVWWDRCLRRVVAPTLIPLITDFSVLGEIEYAIFYHHGWLRPDPSTEAQHHSHYFGESDRLLQCATECARAVITCATDGKTVSASPESEKQMKVASWWIAGLLTFCDWLGSSQRWFPYEPPHDEDSLDRYWGMARARGRRAIDDNGLTPPPSHALRSFQNLTGLDSSPTAIQKWAAECELPDGPLLAIIEDTTGAGKTEAAQMLVHRLLASGRASGAYWAMPTQATANAMFVRQSGMIARLFDPEAGRKPSLALAHGQSRMHRAYQKSVIDSVGGAPSAEVSFEDVPIADASFADAPFALALESVSREMTAAQHDGGDLESITAMSAFMADDSRKALLCDVGAGTIDQALLGVLPSRYNTLRLFALSEKVLVVDEVHAFDAYVTEEIRTLLEFHARLGGHAVALSATLAEPDRRKIERVWINAATARHLLRSSGAIKRPPSPATEGVPDSPYPCARMIGASGVQAFAPPSGQTVSRDPLPVQLVHSTADALRLLADAARDGACAVWIRNTVNACVESARALQAQGVDVQVFHSRFAQGDRQQREQDVLSWSGVKSTVEMRRGKVLLATQVVEQSLDLDFDFMISDLAPIDLLLQRAGRLWRHKWRGARPIGASYVLHVVAPHESDAVTEDWPSRELLDWTSAVYPQVHVLWYTLQQLRACNFIRVPQDVRKLIRTVYESDPSGIPQELQKVADKALGDAHSLRAIAFNTLLKVDAGFAPGTAWDTDTRMPTRLGEPQYTVRIARVVSGKIEPWYASSSEESWHWWSLSETKMAVRHLRGVPLVAARYRGAVDDVRRTWREFEQTMPVLVLQEEGGEWRGSFETEKGVVAFTYDANFGLQKQ